MPCRHHVIELLIKGVFEVYWPTQNGPNVSIFGRFKNNWNKIDKSKYSAGINDPIVAKVLSEKKDETLDFIESYSLVCFSYIISFTKALKNNFLFHYTLREKIFF